MNGMKYLRDIKDSLFMMYDGVSLLLDAIENDRLSEVKRVFNALCDIRENTTWDFQDDVISHVRVFMNDLLFWDQEEGDICD